MKYFIEKARIFRYCGAVYLLAAIVVFLLIDMRAIKRLKVIYNYGMCMSGQGDIFCHRAIKELKVKP